MNYERIDIIVLCKLHFCKGNILPANTIDMIRNRQVDKTDSVIISIMNDPRDATGCCKNA